MSTTEPIAVQRAHGIELIGEFEGSGFKVTPHLARRADGQVVQLTQLLYLVAEASDGQRDVDEIADLVSEQYGRRVTGDNVQFLVDEKLRPLGVLAHADGSSPELKKRVPLLALRHRRPVMSEEATNRAARFLTWLHAPLVLVPMLLAIAAFDIWLFVFHGVAGGLRSAIYSPELLLAVLLSVVVATAFHELGHASACRYGGARPGVMGVGVYLVWPAFYCDVTDAYRLGRLGRLRTDLGGVYFNAIFALLAGGVYFATGQEAALLAASVQYVIILQQLIPLLRFDGYYVLSDLTGVPDILSRIKPIFRSLLRPRRPEPAVAALKPWVRAVVTIYLLILVPELILLVSSMIVGAPRMLATTYDSLGLQLDRLSTASGPAEAGLGGVQIVALVMPVAATSVSLGRTGKRAGRGVYRWASVSRRRAAAAMAAVLAVLAATTYILLPNGDYEPIRPGEHGTIGGAVRSLPASTGGRPAFTPEQATKFAPVPTERQQRSPVESQRAPAQPRTEGRQQRETRPRARPSAAAPRPSSPASRTARRAVRPPPPGPRPPPRRPRPPPPRPRPPPPPRRPPRPR